MPSAPICLPPSSPQSAESRAIPRRGVIMFSGSIPALVTPFDASGDFAEKAFRDLVEWQIAEGSAALVPFGTTGEAATMPKDEHFRVVRNFADQARGRVLVLDAAGSEDTPPAADKHDSAKPASDNTATMTT